MEASTSHDEEYAPPSPTPEYEPPVDEDDSIISEEPDGDEDDEGTEPVEVDAEEILEPKTDPILRVFVNSKGDSAQYIQKTLTYMGKIQLYGLLGRAVEMLMENDGLGVNEIMDMASGPKAMLDKMLMSSPGMDNIPGQDSQETDLAQAGKMMSAFAKIVAIAPDMLLEFYCIILAVPAIHRKWMMEWGLPEMDDETGWDINHAFVDQNWGVMEDFFVQEMPKFFRRAAQARRRHASSGDRSKR